jgi:hypothetical protein
MSKQFILVLLASLIIIGGVVWLTFSSNQSSQLRLQGSILKVRTLALNPQATLVFADFRITNPTGTPFIVDKLEMELERPGQEIAQGGILTRKETDQVFEYQKLAGPKFNEPLIIQDRIQPGQTVDRMVAARFELTEAEAEARSVLRVRILEIDGRESTITDQPAP